LKFCQDLIRTRHFQLNVVRSGSPNYGPRDKSGSGKGALSIMKKSHINEKCADLE